MSAADVHGISDGASDIAARFVQARLMKTALPDYPGEKPLDMATAYATQDAATGLFNAGTNIGSIVTPLVVLFKGFISIIV